MAGADVAGCDDGCVPDGISELVVAAEVLGSMAKSMLMRALKYYMFASPLEAGGVMAASTFGR